jgi:hypothetical protein
MPRAIRIRKEDGYGRVGQWMKTCSCCGKNFVGSSIVERWFGEAKTADGHNYECKRCLKQRRDAKRALGTSYLAAIKQLTGCENPLCTCTPEERITREARLEHHHLDPTKKNFNPSRGVDKPLTELIDEVHLTVCLCKWSHDQTKGYRGSLSGFGVAVARAHEERLNRFKGARTFGVGPP